MLIVTVGTCLSHEVCFDPVAKSLRSPFQGHAFYSYQRTSLISLMASPSPVDSRWLAGSGERWELDWIRDDFEKTFWENHAATADCIVLDMLSERHPLLIERAYPDRAKHYCIRSQTNLAIPLADFDRINPPTGGTVVGSDYFRRWQQAFSGFLSRLSDVNPNCQVLFQEVALAPPGASSAHPVYAYTALFDAMTAEASGRLPPSHILRSRAAVIADPTHPWGAAPFHLTGAYYDDLAQQIGTLLGL